MRLLWMVMAGVGIVAAAFFLARRNFDAAFVAAVLGMVAWFLNYRAQMKVIAAAADLDDENKRDEVDDDEDWNDN